MGDTELRHTAKPFTRSESSAEAPESLSSFLWHTHTYINEHIRFADTKAAAVILFSGAVLGLLFAQGLHRPFTSGNSSADALLSIAAFAALVGAILCGAWSMKPRFIRVQAPGFVFWDSILAHGSETAFRDALRRQSPEEMESHLASQLYVSARIARRKFLWVARAVMLAMAGGFLAAILLFLN